MYLTESSSPLDPGARPSNSSEARTLICLRRPAAVIASSAAFGGGAALGSAPKLETPKPSDRRRMIMAFMPWGRHATVPGEVASNAGRPEGRPSPVPPGICFIYFLSRVRRGYGWLCLFVARWGDPDFFQERLDRLF